MATKHQNFSMFQGETKSLLFTVTGASITGATVEWMLATALGVAPAVSKTTADGITITSSSTFTVTLDPDDTEDLAARTYWHEARVITSAGVESVVTTGQITLEASSTAGDEA